MLKILDRIGEGGCADVMRCTFEEEEYACKIVLQNEIDIHSQLNHPFIVQFHKAIPREDGRYYLIMERIYGVELFDMIMESPMEEKQALPIFQQLCEAVAYLHDLDIVHRDVKLENILIDEKGDVKLCDFGQSGKHDTLEGCNLYTCEYASPESLMHETFLKSMDVWSLGIVLYIMLTGEFPFYSQDQDELERRVQHSQIKYPKTISLKVQNLLEKLLQKDPLQRISVSEILKDQNFFAE
jgi:serine/threonine protein kinase